MNIAARNAEYTAQPHHRFVRRQSAPTQFLFSGRGPVRRTQIDSVMERSRLVLGVITRFAGMAEWRV